MAKHITDFPGLSNWFPCFLHGFLENVPFLNNLCATTGIKLTPMLDCNAIWYSLLYACNLHLEEWTMEQSSILIILSKLQDLVPSDRQQVSSLTSECLCHSNDVHCHKKLMHFMLQKKIKWYLANKEKGYVTFYWNVLGGTVLFRCISLLCLRQTMPKRKHLLITASYPHVLPSPSSLLRYPSFYWQSLNIFPACHVCHLQEMPRDLCHCHTSAWWCTRSLQSLNKV